MLKESGAQDVYFEDEIEVVVADEAAFSMEGLERVLKDQKVSYTTIEPARPE